MSNLTTMTDDELDALRIEILVERERRERLASIPAQIASLAAQYEADGGNRDDLPSSLVAPGGDE